MIRKRNYDEKFIHYYLNEVSDDIRYVFENRDIDVFGNFGCGDGSLIYSLNNIGYLDRVRGSCCC